MKKIIRLTESDLTRIVKKALVTESQMEVDKIKSLNKKYPGQRTAEWCAYAVLPREGGSESPYTKANCYIKNCLGSTDEFCRDSKNCPSCFGPEFMFAHAQILTCMTACFTTKKYDRFDCGVYEGQFYC